MIGIVILSEMGLVGSVRDIFLDLARGERVIKKPAGRKECHVVQPGRSYI